MGKFSLFRTPLFKKASKFAVSGLGATLMHVFVALVLLRVVMAPPTVANGVAYVFANIFSYLANTFWSFGQVATQRNFSRFITTSILGLGLSILISGAAELAGLSDLIGLGLVVLIMPPLMFCIHLMWTYK